MIPAVIFGLLLKKQIDAMLENVIVVAVALLVGGVVFLLLDKWFHGRRCADNDPGCCLARAGRRDVLAATGSPRRHQLLVLSPALPAATHWKPLNTSKLSSKF